MKRTPEYEIYHRRVVEACVELMGEQCRIFFDKQCDFLDEFLAEEDPAQVAQNQLDSL